MIFWKYIKGLNQYTDTTVTPSEVVDLFTFLKFSNEDYEENIVNNSVALLPEVVVNNENAFPSGASLDDKNLGKVITSKASNQTVYQHLRMIDNAKLFFGAYDTTNEWNPSYIYNTTISDALRLYIRSEGTTILESRDSLGVDIYYKPISSGPSFIRVLTVNKDPHPTSASSYVGSVTVNGNFHSGTIYCNSGCNAVYFNSTSDKRAKTNIKSLDMAAVNLIRNTPVYSFIYKDSDLPSIGIIAQDVQDVEIEGFKLVDNEQATGKDYDYMSIHESKLTYILWKAVQEQQEQIESLKKEIDELKNSSKIL